MWSFIKLLLFIVIVIILLWNWSTFINFFSAMIDWIVYWMKTASVGPPGISNP